MEADSSLFAAQEVFQQLRSTLCLSFQTEKLLTNSEVLNNLNQLTIWLSKHGYSVSEVDIHSRDVKSLNNPVLMFLKTGGLALLKPDDGSDTENLSVFLSKSSEQATLSFDSLIENSLNSKVLVITDKKIPQNALLSFIKTGQFSIKDFFTAPFRELVFVSVFINLLFVLGLFVLRAFVDNVLVYKTPNFSLYAAGALAALLGAYIFCRFVILHFKAFLSRQTYISLLSLNFKQYFWNSRTSIFEGQARKDTFLHIHIVKDLLPSLIVRVLSASLTLISAVILMYLIDGGVAAVLLIGVIGSLVSVYVVNKLFDGGKEDKRILNESTLETKLFTLNNPSIVDTSSQLSARMTYIHERFLSGAVGTFKLCDYRKNCYDTISIVITTVLFFIVCTLSVNVFLNDVLTLGYLSVVLIISGVTVLSIYSISRIMADLNCVKNSVLLLRETFKYSYQKEFEPENFDINKGIQIREGSYQYPQGATMSLLGINLSIPKGAIINIVGDSGSGKSTLAKILSGQTLLSNGEVELGGVTLNESNHFQADECVSLIPQENLLPNGTIKDVIANFDQTLVMEEIINAAKLSGAHGFISQLPKGYYTYIGENGKYLSLGQKRAIKIASRITDNNSVLILDDPMLGMDLAMEQAFKRGLSVLRNEKTIVVTSQKPNSYCVYDQIIVLEKGQIIEHGSHSQLMALNGKYARRFSKSTSSGLPLERPVLNSAANLNGGRLTSQGKSMNPFSGRVKVATNTLSQPEIKDSGNTESDAATSDELEVINDE